MPKRIQRRRSKGWRMPAGAVFVGRPTKWGNPFTVDAYWDAGYSGSIDTAARHCVEAFRALLLGERHWAHGTMQRLPFQIEDIAELRGKDLACWCRLDQPCHVDVLLELANGKDHS